MTERMRLCWILACTLPCLLSACDTLRPSDFESEIVVEAHLEAGEPLPRVRVSRTLRLHVPYDAEAAAVGDARVVIHLVGEDGTTEETYPYGTTASSGGFYWFGGGGRDSLIASSPTRRTIVQPLRTYRLVVEVPESPTLIEATTTVPDTFSVAYTNADTVVFQSAEPFVFHVSGTRNPLRQRAFIFSTTALDGFEEDLTPFARSLLDRSGELTLGDLRERASPILNEENFERLSDGAVRIPFPWVAIHFYGRNRITVRALDPNLHDFVRSQLVQQGGSTLPPGEIPNVLENVTGGRGIFGSFAAASAEVVVLSPP